MYNNDGRYSKTHNCDEITIIKVTEWDNKDPLFVGTPTELLAVREEGE